MDRPASDAALREYYNRNYHQLLPIIAEKHFESGTPRGRRDLRKRLGSRRIRSMSESPERRRGQPESPRKRDPERKTVFKRLEKDVFHMLGDKGKSMSAHSNDSRRQSYHSSRRDTDGSSVISEGSVGGHWKSRLKKQRSSIEDDDLSQPWFPVAGGVLTLRSCKIIPIECATVSGPEGQPPAAHQAIKERIKPRRVRLETLGHDWRPKAYSRTSVKYTRRMPSGQAKEEKSSNR
ncbi:hypothetical protein Tco_0734894 [Tanacetum coccineum]